MTVSLPVSSPAAQADLPPHLPALKLDPRTYKRGLSCVHCGLCLPACPTYTQTLNESDSPRGRIQLMLGMADGKIDASASAKRHLDLCLDCRACETACPSGVVYHELIEETRARFLEQSHPDFQSRLMQWIFFHVFVYPTRLKLALLPARIMQKIGLYSLMRKIGIFNILPIKLRKMEQMLPANGKLWPKKLPERTVTSAKPQATVAMFSGCIGSVMFERVNRQAVELLAASGANVISPRAEVCCGAIHHHSGAHHQAMEFARRNIDAFLPPGQPEPDYIATNIAGCGAMLKDYDVLLRDDPQYAQRAKTFASKVRDISQVLFTIGLPEMKYPINETITYHDACHLAHAQRVTVEPRKLLASIPGLKLIPLPESEICCGAAGTYNLEHPAMAKDLARRKLNNIAITGATTCAMGNVGCAMHLSSEAAGSGRKIEIRHPVELLYRAHFGRRD